MYSSSAPKCVFRKRLAEDVHQQGTGIASDRMKIGNFRGDQGQGKIKKGPHARFAFNQSDDHQFPTSPWKWKGKPGASKTREWDDLLGKGFKDLVMGFSLMPIPYRPLRSGQKKAGCVHRVVTHPQGHVDLLVNFKCYR